MLVLVAFLALPLASPARALTADHEKFDFLGWNKQCSAAFGHYAFPKVGEAVVEPIDTRVGTLTIETEEHASKETLLISFSGAGTWSAETDSAVRAKLREDGYGLMGFVETLRPAPVVDQRDLPRLIESTDTYRASETAWLASPWRAATVYYSPFASECALMLYTFGDKPFYRAVLFRIGNPTVRDDRALAHVTNGLLLFEQGDALGALEEERIAATMAPDFGPARYQLAALLTLNGQLEQALDELKAAIALDSKYKKQAREDRNLDTLREDPRFKTLTK